MPKYSVEQIRNVVFCGHGSAGKTSLVDKILAAKRANPDADVSAWEREIDQLVYQLYGLTKEEIEIVEGSNR